MATKLELYNKAMRHIGERKLASLTEDSEARYYLDDEWDGALEFCLRQGLWNFAMRGAMITESPPAPAFGYSYKFAKPTDWIRTAVISTSEFFDPPLLDYQDQTTYWLANTTPLYARFVSTTQGIDTTRFPPDYAEYVGAYLALMIMPRLTQKSEDQIMAFEKRLKMAFKTAQAHDAMDQPPGRPPMGTWVMSRLGRRSSHPYRA